VVDPPGLPGVEEQLLLLQFEHEELQQLPLAPQHRGHLVQDLVSLVSSLHMGFIGTSGPHLRPEEEKSPKLRHSERDYGAIVTT
jgi:hypothetical protein